MIKRLLFGYSFKHKHFYHTCIHILYIFVHIYIFIHIIQKKSFYSTYCCLVSLETISASTSGGQHELTLKWWLNIESSELHITFTSLHSSTLRICIDTKMVTSCSLLTTVISPVMWGHCLWSRLVVSLMFLTVVQRSQFSSSLSLCQYLKAASASLWYAPLVFKAHILLILVIHKNIPLTKSFNKWQGCYDDSEHSTQCKIRDRWKLLGFYTLHRFNEISLSQRKKKAWVLSPMKVAAEGSYISSGHLVWNKSKMYIFNCRNPKENLK